MSDEGLIFTSGVRLNFFHIETPVFALSLFSPACHCSVLRCLIALLAAVLACCRSQGSCIRRDNVLVMFQPNCRAAVPCALQFEQMTNDVEYNFLVGRKAILAGAIWITSPLFISSASCAGDMDAPQTRSVVARIMLHWNWESIEPLSLPACA